MLEVFAIERVALRFNRGGNNQRVVPRETKFRAEAKRFAEECRRRMHGEEWAERGGEVLVGFSRGHRSFKVPHRDIEKFLDDLIANEPYLRLDCVRDELCSFCSFCGCGRVEGIDEDVGVEKKSTAHSFRPV